MSFSEAQLTASAVVSGISATTSAFTNAQPAGNFILVSITWSISSATLSTVTDTSGNTYTQIGTTSTGNGGNTFQSIYWAPNIKAASAGANSVTATFSSSSAVNNCVRAIEFNCSAGSGVSLRTGGAAQNSGSGANADSGAGTTVAGDLLYAGFVLFGGLTSAGAGFTLGNNVNTGSYVDEYNLASAGGSQHGVVVSPAGLWLANLAVIAPPVVVASSPDPPATKRLMPGRPPPDMPLLGRGILASPQPQSTVLLSDTMAGVGAMTANLTGAGALDTVGAGSLAGIGAMTATLAGAGALAMTAAGVGAMTAALTALVAPTPVLRTLPIIPGFPYYAPLGVGILTAPAPSTTSPLAMTASAVGTMSAALAGAGALDTVGAGGFAGVGAFSANLGGSGALADTMAGVGAMSATSSGAGALSDVMAGVGAFSAAPSGVGALSDTMAGVGTLGATLAGAGGLTDVMAGVGAMTASLGAPGSAFATLAGLGALSAAPSGSGALQDVMGGVGAFTATVAGAAAMVSSGLGAMSAALAGSGYLGVVMTAMGAMTALLGSGTSGVYVDVLIHFDRITEEVGGSLFFYVLTHNPIAGYVMPTSIAAVLAAPDGSTSSVSLTEQAIGWYSGTVSFALVGAHTLRVSGESGGIPFLEEQRLRATPTAF